MFSLLKQRANRTLQFVLMIFLLGLGVVLYAYWSDIIRQVVVWQKTFHELLAIHINAIDNDPVHHGTLLIGLSFLYGIFHAIGPGHGKAIIIVYLGSHKESLRRGALISLLAALFQALIAIVLVIVLAQILSIQFLAVNQYVDDVTVVSYVLVMLLGVFLFVSAMWRQLRSLKQTVHHHEHSHHQHTHEHDHDHACCGHNHAHISEPKESLLQSLSVIISMGIRPCAGAILVLIYAHLVGVFYYGIVATLVMGLGTGLAIAAMALATQLARHWFEKLIQQEETSFLAQWNIGVYLRMAGGAVIFLLGLSLFQAATQISNAAHPLF